MPINPGGHAHSIAHVMQFCATHGHFPQVDYNGPFCQMFWHICEGLRNLIPRAGILCAAQSGIQCLRLVDISLRCDQFGRNIHPFIEMVRAQALLPAFHVAAANEEGAKLRMYKCDRHGRDGHGAWTLPGGLEAGAGAVITHAVGQPYNYGCVCANPSWARWHNGWDAVAGL